MFIPVDTYRVHFEFNLPGGYRLLQVLPPAGASSALQAVNLYFMAAPPSGVFPQSHLLGGVQGYIYLPFEEFSRIYDLVRSERPLFATVSLAPYDSPAPPPDSPILTFHLGTSPEPIGEGPMDTSP
jgi:hypothetical protein